MINLTDRLFPQPTLSLYLGGSGIIIGEHLLSMLASLAPADAAFVEPFFIDSQEPKIDDHERARHFCYTDLDQFFQPVYREFSNTRFPENLGVDPVYNSSEGCGVTRIFGAASLAASLDDFADLVEQSIARLKSRRRTDQQPLQVFLTASACGGTGAGMILDIAALVRHFCRAKGENPRIFLFLLGPSVYFEDPHVSMTSEQRDRMRASTYALIKELNHFANGQGFASSYRLRDQPLEIGNVADGDRLFEWVYLLDGMAEKGGATRTLDEVTWMVAETQLHLAMSEVGRKVAESMPNQREQRGREFAVNFVHHDNKSRMPEATRERLQVAGRKTFLASFALRNVRFPADDIKAWFRAGWVREALQKVLLRDDPDPSTALIDQYDRLLGHERGNVLPQGLLADLGLAAGQLTSRLGDDADPERGIPKAPPAAAAPDAAIAAAEKLLTAAEWLLKDLADDSSLVSSRSSGDTGRMLPTRELVERAKPRLIESWRNGLATGGPISARLLQFAWARAGGRGLRFLNDLLNHTIDVLLELSSRSARRPNLAELEDLVASLGDQLAAVKTTRDRERRGFPFRARSFIARRFTQSTYETETLLKRTRPLVQAAIAVRQQLADLRSAHLAASLAPTAWLLAADELRRWRDDVLSPTIIAVENALTLAGNNYVLARQALTTYQGAGPRGAWRSHTTLQVADDDLLAALATRVRDVKVEDVVLVPLQDAGISREAERLTIHSLGTLGHTTAVQMLAWHVEQATRGWLAFLDNGWMLEEVKGCLRSVAAPALDFGSEPLASFSRDAVGSTLQSCLLVSEQLVLPHPFGRRLSRMNRVAARDPLMLTVASFVYGIPPNALTTMRELFEQYTIHVGDQQRFTGTRDRYPLHVFRNAAESFDEPYSPLAFDGSPQFMDSMIEAAQELWADNGGIKLDIREFDAANPAHRVDWNRCVELTEKLLHVLGRSPQDAERLFLHGRFADLRRLYDSRRHRPPTSTFVKGNGSGHVSASTVFGDTREGWIKGAPEADL